MGYAGLKRVHAVAANTFRETVRERVLYNLVLFAILMTLSGTVLQGLSIRQDDKIIKDLGLAAMELFGTLIAVFIGVGLVSKEIERRSLYPLLAKPLSRGEFLLGKFGGLAFTLLVNVGAMAAGLWLTLWAAGHRPDAGLWQAIVPIYSGLLLVVALALLFSTLTSSTLAALGTIAVTLVGRFSDVLKNAGSLGENLPPWFGPLTRGLYWLVPNLRHFDLKARVVHGALLPVADVAWIVGYGAAYTAALLWLAHLSFSRHELQ